MTNAAHPLCDVLNVVPSWTTVDSPDTSARRLVVNTLGSGAVDRLTPPIGGTYKCMCGNEVSANIITSVMPGSKCAVVLDPGPVICGCGMNAEMRLHYERP